MGGGGWILKEGAFARSASLSRLLLGTFLAETRKVPRRRLLCPILNADYNITDSLQFVLGLLKSNSQISICPADEGKYTHQ